MDNKKTAQNCGKNNKPTDVKQDNKNCTNKADKLFSDTVVGGTRYFNTRPDVDDDI